MLYSFENSRQADDTRPLSVGNQTELPIPTACSGSLDTYLTYGHLHLDILIQSQIPSKKLEKSCMHKFPQQKRVYIFCPLSTVCHDTYRRHICVRSRS